MDKILILDFGGKYTHLISRRVRAMSVYTEILPYDCGTESISKLHPSGVILSGGPSSVYEKDSPKIEKETVDWISRNNISLLGLCYGHQVLAQVLGGRVEKSRTKEYGKKELAVAGAGRLLKGIGKTETVWMSHGDHVVKPPKGCKAVASTDSCPVAAYEGENIFGVQFHPEVRHTPCGEKILKNFVFEICGCKPDWVIGDFIEKAVSGLKKEVGCEKVIMGLSGGVDSSVAAALIHEAIGDRLHCVFVDHGLMRKNEAEEVEKLFMDHLGFKNFHVVNAQEEFMSRLEGVSDPEAKRKIIGELFIRAFEKKTGELLHEFGDIKFLGQGTIYPDRVESAATSKSASVIKSHHNVALPNDMKLKLVEPLNDLYKDEVRLVGEKLGLPRELVRRQPFPGPGLAVRCLGAVTPEKIRMLREADAIIDEEIRKADLYEKLWQSFAVFLPVKSVGVMGDARTYENVIALRAVESDDVMTANWAKLPYEVLGAISNRIVNEVRGINRVVYDITQKPPGTVEWE